MVWLFTGTTCSSSRTVSVLHRNTQLATSPSRGLCNAGNNASSPSTAAQCSYPIKGNVAPILLSASLMGAETSRAKPCCLESDFSSSHVLSRQSARTNKRLHCRREKSFNNTFKSSRVEFYPYLAIFLQRSSFLQIWCFVYAAIYKGTVLS